MNNKVDSGYQGSEKTRERVERQIAERWGEKEINNYDPYTNCLTLKKWSEVGYRVKKGERALKGVSYREVRDDNGELIKTFPVFFNLFYEKQVKKVK